MVIAAYTVAALLVAGVALGALASAWHHAHYRPVTELRRRQLADQVDRYGVHDPRPQYTPRQHGKNWPPT